MINRLTALLFTCVSLSAAPASAGQFEDEITRVTRDADAADEIHEAAGGKEGNLVAVPLPIVDPTIGNGLALTGHTKTVVGVRLYDCVEGFKRTTDATVEYSVPISWEDANVREN